MTDQIKPLDRALVAEAVSKIRQDSDARISEMQSEMTQIKKAFRSILSVHQRQLDLFSSQVNRDIEALELMLR